jgi:hypothetical protein
MHNFSFAEFILKLQCIFKMLKRPLAPLIVLFSITVITRLVMIVNSPFVYYFDPYVYLSKAFDFALLGAFRLEVGAPFILSLEFCYHIFGSAIGLVGASRLLMLIMSTLLVSVIYLFGVKLSGKVFGFLVALLAIFEPFFLSYSIVPHNDIFTITLGLVAFYLATTKSKLSYVLAPFLFYMAIFTRPELSLTLIVPIIVFLFLTYLKARSNKAGIKLLFYIIVFVIPLGMIYVYAQGFTRFTISEKFSLFLTPELLSKTLDLSFRFYNQPVFNQILFLVIILSVLLVLARTVQRFFVFQKIGPVHWLKSRTGVSIKDIILSDKAILTFSLLLIFLFHVVAITAYGYEYLIIDGELSVMNRLTDRYLILPRILLSFPLAYLLSTIIHGLCANLFTKIHP